MKTKYWPIHIPNNFTGALEWCDGIEYRWVYIEHLKNGLPHREDGPAKCWLSETKEWYLNGIRYNEEEWKRLIKK